MNAFQYVDTMIKFKLKSSKNEEKDGIKRNYVL